MKKVRKLFLYMAIVVFIGISIFFLLFRDPPSKVLNIFLGYYNDPASMPLDFLNDSLLHDPFLNIFKEGNLIKGYRIKKSQRSGDGKAIITVSLATNYGSIPLDFVLERKEAEWFITKFPKTVIIDGTVPLSLDDRGEYCMDIAGTKLYCKLPGGDEPIKMGIPISLTLMDSYIVEYKNLQSMDLNRVMSASKEYVEDAIYGKIPIEDPIIIYDVSGELPKYIERDTLPIGMTHITIFSSRKSPNRGIMAYIDTSKTSYDTIRIVLNNSNFNSLYHDKIVLSSTEGITIKNLVDNLNYDIGPDREVTFTPNENGEIHVFNNGELLGASIHRWYILPKGGSRIIINNMERSHSFALKGTTYRGNMEISREPSGLVIVNEVGLEEYLYTVVPSEMPVKFGLESLKVQAIAARSYAARCLNALGYAPLGAHVDDSTSSQMYNNSEEYDIVLKAVDDTRGLVPVYSGDIVDARFFSTSWGYTANFHETWSVKDEFPSHEVPYLVAKPQFPGNAASLYNEENFKAFINKKDTQAYDRFSPFFRWSITMKGQQLEDIIQENLPRLQKNQPQFILTRDENGAYISRTIPEELGRLLSITPIQRGQGGNIMEIEISTTTGIYRILKELNIRQLLRPVNLTAGEEPITIKRSDGSVIKDFSILPSPFFYMDIIRDNRGVISNIVFTGGGYGHGVGMSQHGVYGLSLLGKSYREIIEHFYPDTELKHLY